MPPSLTRKRRPAKPSRPHADYPLTANGNGQWSKKIRGKVYYFGPWSDPQGALERYVAAKDDLLAGRKPKPRDGFTIKHLCNSYLSAKRERLLTGELSTRGFEDCYSTTDAIVGHFDPNRLVEDLGPEDFTAFRAKLAEGRGPVALKDRINRTRMVFRFAFENGFIDKPIRFGSEFQGPSRRTLRLERRKRGPKMFEAEEVRKLLDAASPQVRAMILLGVNCAFGNTDCATLPLSALDLEAGWINFHRPKTGIDRRCPLWPETVQALREVIAARPNPRDEAGNGLVFLTLFGMPWVKVTPSEKRPGRFTHIDSLGQEFGKLLRALGLNGSRGFYSLRHTFETVAGGSKDQIAVNAIMGHVDDSMAAVYRERIDDSRLLAVVEHVRKWLYANKP